MSKLIVTARSGSLRFAGNGLKRSSAARRRRNDRRGTPVSKARRRQVFDRDDNRCIVCGSRDDLTADHIIPCAKGGTNDLDNLQTMCGPCNTYKGDRLDAFPDGMERAA